jgi:hypothetical protein
MLRKNESPPTGTDGDSVGELAHEEIGLEMGREPYEQLIRRSHLVSQSLGRFHPASDGGEGVGSGVVCPPGDFHHFHTSISQDVSGGAPQHFHQGREFVKDKKERDLKRVLLPLDR